MGATLVVARGRSVFVLADASPPREFPVGGARAATEASAGPARAPDLPPGALEALRGVAPSAPIVVCGRVLHDVVASRLSRSVRRAGPADWHRALDALPAREPSAEREELLRHARAELDSALRSPGEVLVSLAREEERVARGVGREARAAEAFVAVPGTALAEHARAWSRVRELLAEHHRELADRLEAEARRTVPNLSAVVGARTAARLVAAAGGVAPLSRMSASRLQLLGSRRRPSAERGPRYGVLYLAEGADSVPPDRRAAYVRSVAALAAIAARADALTHGDLAGELVRRREARRAELGRRRR